MSLAEADWQWMARALVLARQGRFTAHPNPCVGAVLVRDGKLIGQGWHRRAGEGHAEVVALAGAGDARGSTCYVTLEPCAHTGRTGPCCEALAAAGVARVVVAVEDPNPQVSGRGIAYLREKGISVDVGVLRHEARDLNAGFFKRMEQGRPRVVVKLASTLDGATALDNGDSQWITCEAARWDVQRLRAQSGAVITGAGTVVADDPRLTVRGWPGGPSPDTLQQPLRVVLDPSGRVSPSAKVFSGGHALWVTDTEVQPPPGVERISSLGPEPLEAVLSTLATRWETNQVLVEAGAKLAAAFLKAGLVDELRIYQAARLAGPEHKPLLAWPRIERMADAWVLPEPEIRRVGTDWRLRFDLRQASGETIEAD
jgi:diaminohydroxyphosphoribosylaminopyrimidine deaminase/5-amino-6-(5-phosphoribosylamino)uracil reductase